MKPHAYALPTLLVAAWLCASPATARAEVTPQDLTCEYRTEPLGIDVEKPRLGWTLRSDERGQRQTAYQVLVAGSPKLLEGDVADLWDSGKVISSESIGVTYAGKPLGSGQRVWWKVRAWDKDDAVSPYSQPAWWEIALLAENDWQGTWIRQNKPLPQRDEDFYKDRPAPLLRRSFTVTKEIQRARVYVSGLGYYELSVNGQKVGDHVLDPGWTAYAKRVLYATYDVTESLRPGENVLGVVLGGGWYNPLPLRMWGRLNLREHLAVGSPRVILQMNIEYTDGSRESIVTDGKWKVAEGPILTNSVYLGETYDARRGQPGWNEPSFDDSGWQAAVEADQPLGPLKAQSAPPIKVTQTIKPVRLTEPQPGVFVFDMGQNFAGWVRLRVKGKAGTKVTMTCGELLHLDGTVNARTSACGQINKGGARGGPGAPQDAFQRNTYILKGEEQEVYTPRFTFHGFRYVQVTGYPGTPTLDALDGLRLNSAVQPAGWFSCSNKMLNRVQEMTRWTLRSNLQSVQSDCPHREKFGYGGDIAVTAEAAIFNFNMARFYAKTVRDFQDAARPNGGLTETAPYVGIADFGLGQQSGPIGWGTAHPLLQRHLLQYYGDRQIIEEQYKVTGRWIALLESTAEDYLLPGGIGDHEGLAPKSTALTGTAFFYYNVRLAQQLAAATGQQADAQRYEKLAQRIKEALNKRFLDPKTGRYDTGTQANQAIPLALGLVPETSREDALKVLVDDVLQKHDGHLTTGIFGTNYMLQALSEAGRADVACTVVTRHKFPGWGHMLHQGGTTLWEHWAFDEETFSHNHPAFGSVSAWFYKTLAGIQPAPDAIGFDKIIIRPQVVGNLTWVKARYGSIRGPVESSWTIEQDGLKLEIYVPVGTTATVYVPAGRAERVTESGHPASESPGVQLLRTEDRAAVFAVGSGRYQFAVK